MNMAGKAAIGGIFVFAALQVVRPGIPTKPATAEVQASPEVKSVLNKGCYSCHSDERRLSWFDQIVPGYWLVRHDILTAREHLNFSTLGSKAAAAQKAALYEAVNMIQLGAMPLPSFLKLHPGSKVAPAELASLKAYLAPWSTAPGQPPGASPAGDAHQIVAPVLLSAVQPEFNGFPFDPNFEGFALLTTDAEGRYRFKTIKPGGYPAAPGLVRPPHIHFDVRGEVDVLVTQMYFEGEPENDKDWFLQSIPAPGRSRLTVGLLAPTSDFEADSKLAVFDIVLNSG